MPQISLNSEKSESLNSPADHQGRDSLWVRQAKWAAIGALRSSKRRLRQYRKSLPDDSPEAKAIDLFLEYGV